MRQFTKKLNKDALEIFSWEAGLDPAEFQDLIERTEVKDQLKENTERAVSRGAFGCPTFFVGDEMFFGQDRLDDLRQALTGP